MGKSLVIFLSILFLATTIAEDEKPVEVTKNNGTIPLSTTNTTNDPAKVISTSPYPNVTSSSATTITSTTTTSTTTTTTTQKPMATAVEQEHNSSMNIFFVLCVIALGILLIHCMLQTHFQFVPESIVVVCLGGLIGLILSLSSVKSFIVEREDVFSPTAFFLVLLPPIIFESGYNLHKGNFFQNIGSIVVFAIFGTAISALVIGSGVYLLGIADVAYRLNFIESFAFGSLISAVDPVATIAIFHALDIDPVLNMLVFGESILNDAISIVLTTTVMPTKTTGEELLNIGTGEAILMALNRFCMMFFASAGIGVVFALMNALLLKYIGENSLNYILTIFFLNFLLFFRFTKASIIGTWIFASIHILSLRTR